MHYTATVIATRDPYNPSSVRERSEDDPGLTVLAILVLAGLVAALIFRKPKGPTS